ncbi:MAG TPA: Asp-tRNA(Asn)/Glu-tRNA(Gln) amidotransferase subunit GatC [Syntrophorhabdaceae bacterium]|nr:Asp-tRNA(Asn)/Glu-tRNA(Gln) amidotransferase subunit GatC [Syntrophorhabdaceae bacterium]HOL05446.1 Asp-tRNA(Asn)/Glu-tRNA(Gln) amidotransferase subunit GatC [Syntrophorhabdaceae bacterium]HON85088.1 Asp-tRNA(Asn)/Glu-tRNA(Gln) amidotransferase subunit GatC [Syntrophorhabdaceae bacterium]HOT42572.1 Asp-tRNA(Asn)/Glu-tRNA(Gln) amidotransferase subunit GatC [Syntrophorhabdaceae bacterium]HPC66754.1 Asp-tRNA(Asn)/Glu-tRNA(Gln) amidotransferase subunit GatC [Syntrophorhabdaceae bacterium]
MKITSETVEYVAHLARLELAREEIDLYTNQLNSILDYMDALNRLDTQGIEPTSHPMPLNCVMRDDDIRESFTVEASTQNAPERIGSFFKVPPIIEVEE